MENTLLINLGNNDIKIIKDKREKLKDIFSDNKDMLDILNDSSDIRSNYRKFTELLLKRMDEVKRIDDVIECVEFPIIKATMKKVKLQLREKKLDRICIFCTNQNNHDEGKKDTIHLGKIIKKLFAGDKGEQEKLGLESTNGNIKCIIKECEGNPADYDNMLNYYEEVINKFNNENLKELYLSITGGTPAMNTCMLLKASSDFKGKIYTYYTAKDDIKAFTLQITEVLRKENLKKQIEVLIKNQGYKAAELLLEESRENLNIDNNKIEDIILILRASESRIHFDFEKAECFLEKARDKSCLNRSILSDFYNSIKRLLDKNRIYLLNELKNNAIFQYESGAYTDFLGRVFRLQEDIYNWILEEQGFVEYDNRKRACLKLDKVSEEQIEKLDNVKIEGKSLIYRGEPLNTKSMEKILEVLLENNSPIVYLFNECKELKKLKDLRNKSILAHGYEGASKEIIDNLFNDRDIREFLDNILNKIIQISNEKLNYDDFYKKDGSFNNKLLELIEEL